MGHLTGPQLTVLALWSYGMVLAKTCRSSQVIASLATTLGVKESNLRQRLREWYWNKEDKQGRKRTDWSVQESFAPLLGWILTLWAPGERRLCLAMDASSLKQVFVVLSISVVYRSCAIPVAWAVLPGNQKGAWKEPWLGLFKALRGVIPPDWQVIVLADRGLYARWLFEAIQDNQWHPFLRINLRSTYRPKGAADFRPMRQLLPTPGAAWAGQVTCFASNPVESTLLAFWGEQHREPWLILTDLPPDSATAAWYGMRSWIEASFKDMKRGGWQWQSTRMTDPVRVERFWLALAVSTVWVLLVGGQVDAHLPAGDLEALPATHIARVTQCRKQQPRLLSCFSRGLIQLTADLINHCSIVLGVFLPEPWPVKTYP